MLSIDGIPKIFACFKTILSKADIYLYPRDFISKCVLISLSYLKSCHEFSDDVPHFLVAVVLEFYYLSIKILLKADNLQGFTFADSLCLFCNWLNTENGLIALNGLMHDV